MKCGQIIPQTHTAPSGRQYYISGIHQEPIGTWWAKIRYTDNLEFKDVAYNKIFL